MIEGKKVRVTPDAPRAGLDASAGFLGFKPGKVIGDFQGPKALLTKVTGSELILGAALFTPQVAD